MNYAKCQMWHQNIKYTPSLQLWCTYKWANDLIYWVPSLFTLTARGPVTGLACYNHGKRVLRSWPHFAHDPEIKSALDLHFKSAIDLHENMLPICCECRPKATLNRENIKCSQCYFNPFVTISCFISDRTIFHFLLILWPSDSQMMHLGWVHCNTSSAQVCDNSLMVY